MFVFMSPEKEFPYQEEKQAFLETFWVSSRAAAFLFLSMINADSTVTVGATFRPQQAVPPTQ